MKTLFLFLALALPNLLFCQQIADTGYHPVINDPAYGAGLGPVVFIDGGHHNFHTKEGRYKPFASLLERDGYVVKAYEGPFVLTKLIESRILVIANALNELNVEDWYLPTPSAFTREEINVLVEWVRLGGCLFLIADHMPMAGAAKALASEFGFEFTNGFAFNINKSGPAFFSIENGTLKESLITKGRDPSESIDHIVTFTGQGFKIPDDAKPVLVFDKNYFNFLPDTAWVFHKETPKYGIEGLSQGAYKKFGKGKIAVFGEAAMFTAQLTGPGKTKAGMNSAIADENYRLLLNIIHWLDGLDLEEPAM